MSEVLKEVSIEQLYDLKETIAYELFEGVTYQWEVLPKIKDFIISLGTSLPEVMIRSKKMYGLQKVQMCILLPISTDLQSLMKKQKSDIVPLSVATQLSESMLW